MTDAGNVQSVAVAPARPTAKMRRKPTIERLMAELPNLEERLKAERVEQYIKMMPGWSLEKDGRTITRLRQFEDAAAAAKYAAYVQDFAGARGVAVSTLRWDQFVMVTLFGPRRSRSFDLLNAGALRFALSLG